MIDDGAPPGSAAPAEAQPPGTVITFYSYKGGTGRSMAVANTACILAEQAGDPRGVLMIDWDLEAPGLHRYFESRMAAPNAPGLLELLCALRDAVLDGGAEAFFARFDDELARCALPIETPYPLSLIRAGRIDASYASRLAGFGWEAMFRRDPAVFTRLAGELARRYRYVLIDARTGISDSSGICSMLMPEKLVLVFTPNHQSLDGVLDGGRRAASYRKGSDDLRPLTVFPLASRIDAQDSLQRTVWRTGGVLPSGIRVAGYQPQFERLFEEVYGVEDCDLAGYFEAVQVPHDTAFAYGERVAMLEPGTQDRFSLGSSYRHLARYLTRDEPPWSTGEPLFDVVLLHAGIDTPRVRQLAGELRAHGVNPWFQETTLHPGHPLFLGTESIDRVMASARRVALCAGSATVDALEPWAAVAYRHAKPIIPILFEDYQGDALPLALKAVQDVDFRRPGAMASLIKGITADEIAVPAEPRRDVAPIERPAPVVGAATSSPASAFVAPFKVHLCWFDNPDADPACAAIARMLYEFLHRPLEDDAVGRPGLEIPVEYGRDLTVLLDALSDDPMRDGSASSAARSPRIEPVGVRLVIALLDAAALHSERDRRTVQRARARWSMKRTDEYFLPFFVNVGGGWWTEFRSQASHEIPPTEVDGPVSSDAAHWMIAPEVARIAGAAMLGRVQDLAPPEPHLLLSYSEQDGVGVARRLASSLRNHRVKVHLSLGEAPAGARDQMARQLELAGDDAVVVAIRTDCYAENPVSDAELLAAKRARAPIVTLLALEHGESVTSAYGGNHRTLVWKQGNERELVARCTQAWLHGHHFRAHATAALASAGLPADSDILPRRPELVDVVGVRAHGGLIVHPDPPLPDADAALLRAADPSVRIATPTTLLGRVLLAQDPEPALTGTAIALSLSPAEDLPRVADGRVGSGITQEHLDDAVSSIVLAALRSGARIAYGGDFRRNPYGRDLVELHCTYGGLGSRASAQLMYFGDPATADAIDVWAAEFEAIRVAAPAGADRFTDLYKVLWTFAMRERMAERCTGRILLGGRARPRSPEHDRGYSGPWPGLLEEAWRTLRRGR
ncbi:MAG TPA: TIR domain-containing protein, partial [Kofleriaceae bacterium]